MRWKKSEGGGSKAEQGCGCGQDSSLIIVYPLIIRDRSGTVRNRVQTPDSTTEKGKWHKCKWSGERCKEKGRLTPRHLHLSKTVVPKVVPTGSTS